MLSKRKLTLKIAIPHYPRGKTKTDLSQSRSRRAKELGWRRSVHRAVRAAALQRGVEYRDLDLVDVEILLYMSAGQLHAQDVDNLTKHIFDALQGKLAGGPKAEQNKNWKLIQTDARIHRLTVEKRKPRTEKLKSRLIVRGYRTSGDEQ